MDKKELKARRWQEIWWQNLSLEEKLLYQYLCDMCDIAGFYTINLSKISEDLKLDEKTIRSKLNAIRHLYAISNDKKILYLINYVALHYQLPLQRSIPFQKPVIELLESQLQSFSKIGQEAIKILIPRKDQPPLIIPHSGSQIIFENSDAIRSENKFVVKADQPSNKPTIEDLLMSEAGNKKRGRRKGEFEPPTLLELTNYFSEQINKNELLKDWIDPEKIATEFILHYEDIGWKLKSGSNKKMTDWMGVVRTWLGKRERSILVDKKKLEMNGRTSPGASSKAKLIMQSAENAKNIDWNNVLNEGK